MISLMKFFDKYLMMLLAFLIVFLTGYSLFLNYKLKSKEKELENKKVIILRQKADIFLLQQNQKVETINKENEITSSVIINEIAEMQRRDNEQNDTADTFNSNDILHGVFFMPNQN